MNKKPFICYDHGTDQIDLTKIYPELSLFNYRTGRPISLHLKTDGDLNDKSSFCIVTELSNGVYILSEISLRMLNEGLKDIGYAVTTVPKFKGECKEKVNGLCPHHNLHCNYPDCEYEKAK